MPTKVAEHAVQAEQREQAIKYFQEQARLWESRAWKVIKVVGAFVGAYLVWFILTAQPTLGIEIKTNGPAPHLRAAIALGPLAIVLMVGRSLIIIFVRQYQKAIDLYTALIFSEEPKNSNYQAELKRESSESCELMAGMSPSTGGGTTPPRKGPGTAPVSVEAVGK
jgi:hypothetical protein